MATDGYEWDAAKADSNLRKHGVEFADAVAALEDPLALTVLDPDSNGNTEGAMGLRNHKMRKEYDFSGGRRRQLPDPDQHRLAGPHRPS